jgi:acetyl esterase/lipase
MSVRRWAPVGIGAALLALAVIVADRRPVPPPPMPPSATTIHGLPLHSASSTDARPPIVADLYRPKPGPGAESVPLLVVFQGNDPSRGDDSSSIGGDVGDVMQRKGIATLVLSFNASKGYSLRSCAGDLAFAIKEVQERERFSRVVLLGRGSGAWMAAMLGLDRRLFEAAGVDPKTIGGVIGIRGTYDVTESGLDGNPDREFFAAASDDRNESSPARFVRADAPPFLLLTGADDDGTWPRLARSFALTLENVHGDVESFVAPRHDQHSITHWGGTSNQLGDLVVSFVTAGRQPLPIESTYGVRQRWTKKPPLDNDELRADTKRIATYPVDAEFKASIMSLLGVNRSELNVLPGKTYQAIELLPYLASRPESEVGKGDYLVVTNIRDERLYYSREELEKMRPVIVVGLDDETNLYRIFVHYRLKQAYSWKKGEAPMPTMIRPLGAFLHFRTTPPPALLNRTFAQLTLTTKSFRWVESDPLASVRDLTGPVHDVLLGEQGCLKCHAFRGMTAKAHHTLAIDGKPYGAFALRLDEYPNDVLRRFLFEQTEVARSFDVDPLRVDPSAAKSLFDLVTREPHTKN